MKVYKAKEEIVLINSCINSINLRINSGKDKYLKNTDKNTIKLLKNYKKSLKKMINDSKLKY